MGSKNTLETDKYQFSSKIVWLKKGGQFLGTIGVTSAGRLEFILDGGKLIFSVPLALTQQRWMFAQNRWFVVVGTHKYTFQFYEFYGVTLLAVPFSPPITPRQDAYAAFKALKNQIEAFAPPPADNDPIVAADLPAYLKPVTRLAQKGAKWFGILACISIPALLIAISLYSVNKISVGGLWTVIIVSVTWFLAQTVWQFIRYAKLTVLTLPEPSAADLETSKQDVLPAGTPPTAKLGMSTGAAFLLGLILAAGIIALPYIIIGLFS